MMKRTIPVSVLTLLLLSGATWTPSARATESAWTQGIPWRQAGLSEQQAVAHLLQRFAYGPRPGDIDAVLELGIGNWVESQLAGDLPGPVLQAKLDQLPAMALTPKQMVWRYSNKGVLVQEAVAKGLFTMADYTGKNGGLRLRDALASLDRYAADRGMTSDRELLAQLKAQKVLRAVHSEAQLVEVLTDFWFNHFNVSATQPTARVHILSYERDAIRPRVLSSFRELLGATARHPAMLGYLGNAQSVANPEATTTFDLEVTELDRLSPLDNPTLRMRLARNLGWYNREARLKRTLQPRGLNENYARELLELHTLGVNGGYSQRDVIEVARAFTGWTTFPPGGGRAQIEKTLVNSETAVDMGFVIEDEFVFRADHHDSDAKVVLGVPLAAGRGIEDGEEVLDLVARHPATLRHLARKLAVRFVSEQPPASLVQRLVATWELTDGDLRAVMRTLISAPEFWDVAAQRSKIKTPLELAASALRALDADVTDAKGVVSWLQRMGQPIYAFPAPTGFPDEGGTWTHVGKLLARVNFGRDLSRGAIAGVRLDLLAWLGQDPLRRFEDAVEWFFPVLMPERDPSLTASLIAAGAEALEGEQAAPRVLSEAELARLEPEQRRRLAQAERQTTVRHAVNAVSLLIGSPEFQVN
ncbi:MAG: DUF1800 domain-containing protein [Acidobacteriota bacterium]